MAQAGFIREHSGNNDPYIGKWVKVDTQITSYAGVYQGQRSGEITLCPSFVNEPFYRGGKSFNFHRLEENIPTKINLPGAVQPITSEYIDRFLDAQKEEIARLKPQEQPKELDDSFYL